MNGASPRKESYFTMMTLLLIVIFTAFIGLGLPDSVLGTAWPVIYQEMNIPISSAGYIHSINSVFTILSSLCSAHMIKRLGTGWVTALSTLLTAAALLGFSMTRHPAWLFLLSAPLGFGAGAVDTALNSFVAQHFDARRMNFLHCFYGVGVTISPYVMSLALSGDNNWRKGYLIVALIQFGITAVTILSLPLWKRAVRRSDAEVAKEENIILPYRKLFRMRGIPVTALAFFCICSIEVCAGAWSASFFVDTKGLHADIAAKASMLFYLGLALGRFLSGLVAGSLSCRKILHISSAILGVGILLMLPFLPTGVTAFGLLLVGIGMGPLFPNLTHLTPLHFGNSYAQSIIGLQMASAYVGMLLMHMVFGYLAELFTPAVLQPFLFIMFVAYAYAYVCIMHMFRGRS